MVILSEIRIDMQKLRMLLPTLLASLGELQLKHRKHDQQETLGPDPDDEFNLAKKFGGDAQPWITNLGCTVILIFLRPV